jgi:hypothetical protein
MPVKYYPALEVVRDWIFLHHDKGILRQLALVAHHQSLKNKIEYHGITCEDFCAMMRTPEMRETHTRKSTIFAWIDPPIGKVVVTPGIGPMDYTVEFIKDSRYFLSEEELEQMDKKVAKKGGRYG